jgi:glucosamine--fructose-6-phosphate aminotransferase (isomerizing)
MDELKALPDKIQDILDNSSHIKSIAKKYHIHKNWLFLARKYNYPIAMEGALKLKEISYIHAEGYAAGEMKHGPIALIDDNTPSLFIAPKDEVYSKVISNINEVKSRGGPIIAIATRGDSKIKDLVDDVIYIPETLDLLYPILTVIPCQLLAYYCASYLGRDIDQPRNLAKSVTVE